MKVIVLTPHGYCNGVKRALNIAKMALKDESTPRPIYLLGNIIHNKHANKELRDLGAIIMDEKLTRLEMLDQINRGTVIISAHGASNQAFDKAKSKNLNIIDATCPSVKKIHSSITKHLDMGYDCYFIGKESHAECEGVLGINKKIKLINNLDFTLTNNSYVTNQSTLSLLDTKDIYDKIKKDYPNTIIDNNICKASTDRQFAVINQEKVDLCIIVGDKTSSNCKRLKEVSKYEAIFIEDLNELLKYDLTKYESVSVTSGASTPEYILNEIIKYLINY